MLSPDDFAELDFAYHVDCGECGADAHLVNWKVTGEPDYCPFCGSDDARFWKEEMNG